MTTKQINFIMKRLQQITDSVTGRIPTEEDGAALLLQADEMLKLTEKSRASDRDLDRWLKITYESVMVDWIRSQREGMPL